MPQQSDMEGGGEIDPAAGVEDAAPAAAPETTTMRQAGSGTGTRRVNPIETSGADLRCVYRPIWDVERGALLAYHCAPVPGAGEHPLCSGSRESRRAVPRAEILAFDQFVVNEATGAIRELAKSRRRFLLSCCVHYETLAHNFSRAAHAAAYKQIPKGYRKCVIFEVIDAPRQVSRIQLGDALAGLRDHTRAVRCRVGLDWTGFDKFRGIGIDAFGIDVGELALSEQALIKRLDGFCERVHEAGFACFAHGVHTKSLATSCVGAGVTQLDGDAVQASIDSIGPAYRYQPADLFAHLMKAKD
jgi:hypothetical protein